ncbi:hypothetical protein Tco_1127783 [Tanacetum coccineum]
MNVYVCHKELSNQTPSLLTIHVTVILKTLTTAATTILPPIPPFIPPPHQSTPTPTLTPIPTTTTIPVLLDFSSLFEFNQRVSNLEKGLSELKQKEDQAEKERYIDLIKKSVNDIINDEVKTQLPQILPKAVSDFATPELYKALVNSYNVDKDLFLVYGKVVSLKRGREDKDKDEDPPVGSDQGMKRQKISKDVESSKGSKLKESKSTSSSKGTTRSQPKSSSKSAQAEDQFI